MTGDLVPSASGLFPEYSADAGAAICAEIACGKSVREVCRGDGMPAMSTVFRWLAANEDFAKLYAQARLAQMDYIAEEILEIADDSSNDYMERKLANGGTERVVDHENINRSRLRIHARQWLLGKLQPKKYGGAMMLAGDAVIPTDSTGLRDAGALESVRRMAYIFFLAGQQVES